MQPIFAHATFFYQESIGAALPIVSSAVGKRVGQLFDIVRYGENVVTAAGPALVKHHGIMDVWARYNIPGYVTRNGQAPSILLTADQPRTTVAVFNAWRLEQTGSITGPIDWANMSPQVIQDLAYRMFVAAGVPDDAIRAYFEAFHRYLYEELP